MTTQTRKYVNGASHLCNFMSKTTIITSRNIWLLHHNIVSPQYFYFQLARFLVPEDDEYLVFMSMHIHMNWIAYYLYGRVSMYVRIFNAILETFLLFYRVFMNAQR